MGGGSGGPSLHDVQPGTDFPQLREVLERLKETAATLEKEMDKMNK